MRYPITTQRPSIQLWLTLCLPPWTALVSIWTPLVPTSAAGPHTTKESTKPLLSSHAAFSLKRAKYDLQMKDQIYLVLWYLSYHVCHQCKALFVKSKIKYDSCSCKNREKLIWNNCLLEINCPINFWYWLNSSALISSSQMRHLTALPIQQLYFCSATKKTLPQRYSCFHLCWHARGRGTQSIPSASNLPGR